MWRMLQRSCIRLGLGCRTGDGSRDHCGASSAGMWLLHIIGFVVLALSVVFCLPTVLTKGMYSALSACAIIARIFQGISLVILLPMICNVF